MERLKIALTDGTLVLPDGTSPRDLSASQRQLESTYLIRLWAEFETAVRSYHTWWTHNTNPRLPAIDLVNTVTVAAASKGRAFSVARREKIHDVREYRNSLIHERDQPAPPVTLSEAMIRLNNFLGAKLPEQWG